MIINNARNWSPYSTLQSLLWAVGSFVVISFCMINLGPSFFSVHPYKFYFLAATILSFYFGYRISVLYVLISSIFANLYFVPPYGSLELTPEEFERYLINLLFGSAAIFLIEILQRERFKSKLLLLVAESRYLILLHRDNQLLQQLKRNKL